MSLWSFQGARELESPPAEITAVAERPAPPISQNSTAYWPMHHRGDVIGVGDEVDIHLGEL